MTFQVTDQWARRTAAIVIVNGANVLMPPGQGGWPWNWFFSHLPTMLLWLVIVVAILDFVYRMAAGFIKALVTIFAEWRDGTG